MTFGQVAGGGEIAAIITAIGVLIGAVFGGIYKFLQSYDGRMDRASADAFKSMRERCDDALAGEARMMEERDQARRETARAYKERDRWQERATTAELSLARRPTKESSDDDP